MSRAMNVYLAARYSRREELNAYAADLRLCMFRVTSRWLEGNHQISDDGLSAEAKQEERIRFASEDWEDLLSARILIAFTEPPRSTNSRGGRHVELGAALALLEKGYYDDVIVVGYRENVFCCLPQVKFFPTWQEAFEHLTGQREYAA